jgi:hypothetical protein
LLEPGPLQNAIHRTFTRILSCGILPALNQQISQARELGIFEHQICFGCHLPDLPENPLDVNHDFGVLSEILGMCTDQNFFQALCTRTIESTLLGVLQNLYSWYVFVLEFWK